MNALGNTFKYPVSKLLTALTANREQHIKDYDEAVINYKKILIEELEKMLGLAKEGQAVGHNIALRKPESHVKQYDQAITMLNMTSDTEIEIDGYVFAQLVMDEWDWQDSFTSNTKSFSTFSLSRPGGYSSIRR